MSHTSHQSHYINRKKFCALRILPFIVGKNGEISLLLGLDKRFKEWTPFGGNCSESTGSCHRKDTSILKKCLTRELSEESKLLIDLESTVDFANCTYLQYIINIDIGDITNNIYFARWKGDSNKIISLYGNKKRDDKIVEKLKMLKLSDKGIKSYFEMDKIEFITVTSEVFGEYIYNSIQDFYRLEETYRKDKVFYNQVTRLFSSLFKTYHRRDMGDTRGRRFDPRFLMGLIESMAEYFDIDTYSYIDDIVDDITAYVRGFSEGCSLVDVDEVGEDEHGEGEVGEGEHGEDEHGEGEVGEDDLPL